MAGYATATTMHLIRWKPGLQLNLHTADPGELGEPIGNTASFLGYVAVRSFEQFGAWRFYMHTIPMPSISNIEQIIAAVSDRQFKGVEIITHASVSQASDGALIAVFTLTIPVAVAGGMTLIFPPHSLICECDDVIMKHVEQRA
jgi:hypothetical protein